MKMLFSYSLPSQFFSYSPEIEGEKKHQTNKKQQQWKQTKTNQQSIISSYVLKHCSSTLKMFSCPEIDKCGSLAVMVFGLVEASHVAGPKRPVNCWHFFWKTSAKSQYWKKFSCCFSRLNKLESVMYCITLHVIFV